MVEEKRGELADSGCPGFSSLLGVLILAVPDEQTPQPLVEIDRRTIAQVLAGLGDRGTASFGVVSQVLLVGARAVDDFALVTKELSRLACDLLGQLAHGDLGCLDADVVGLPLLAAYEDLVVT